MFSVLIEIIDFRSRKFLDFTEKCLIKNYKERPNAEQMLTHSFSNSTIPDKIVKVQLREVIDRARRRKDDQRAAVASNRYRENTCVEMHKILR